ncbi:MAG TPA: type II secretion system F family protein [Acidobacteriaceae bacterium]|nr:type II secretion system F family protein [Acidobacteriaceae bacterium]
MSLLLLFVFILVAVFTVVVVFTQPTRAEKLAHARLQAAAGRGPASAAQRVDILRHDSYSKIPWLNSLFGKLTPAARLQKLIIEADLDWSVGRLLLGSLTAFLVVYWICEILSVNALVIPLLVAVAFAAPYTYVIIRRKRQFRKFSALLPEAMDLVSRALQAGHSLTAALDLVGQEIADPVGKEFRRVSEEQNLGLPLRDALLNLADRIPIPDVQFLVAAMLIQRETGGNLVEVLDKTTALLRERIRLQGEIRIYTAQGRLTGWILCVLPIVMFFTLNALNPNYTAPLLNQPVGRHLLVAGAVFMALGVLIIRSIVRIKV